MQEFVRFLNKECEIHSATCEGLVGDPYWCDWMKQGQDKELNWFIRLDATSTSADGESPLTIEWDGISIPCSHWRGLVGQQLAWSPATQRLRNGRLGWIDYGADPFEIVSGELQIEGREGTRLLIRAAGQDELGMSFDLRTSFEFQGITVRGIEGEDSRVFRDRLQRYLGLDGLVQQPIKVHNFAYDSGVVPAESRFLPE